MGNDLISARLVVSRPRAVHLRSRRLGGVLLGAALAACATSPTPDAARSEPLAANVATAEVASAEVASAGPRPAVVGTVAGDEPPAAAPVKAPVPPIDEAGSVFFASRSAWIDAAGQQKLRAVADRLAANRRATVLLIGHSDGQGSRSYNLAITEERLTAVGKLLRRYGVSARQVRRNRVGSVRNTPDCQDEACWQQARRVELVVTP